MTLRKERPDEDGGIWQKAEKAARSIPPWMKDGVQKSSAEAAKRVEESRKERSSGVEGR